MNDDLRKMVKPLEWEPGAHRDIICRGWDRLLGLEFFYRPDRTCSAYKNGRQIHPARFPVQDVDEAEAKAAAHAYYADEVLAGLTPAAIAALSRAVEGPLFKLPSQLDASELPERLWAAFEPDEGGWFVETLSLDGGHPGDIEFLRADLLSNPVAVHLNMLVGKIAKPTPEQIRHIYGAALDAAAEEAPADV